MGVNAQILFWAPDRAEAGLQSLGLSRGAAVGEAGRAPRSGGAFAGRFMLWTDVRAAPGFDDAALAALSGAVGPVLLGDFESTATASRVALFDGGAAVWSAEAGENALGRDPDAIRAAGDLPYDADAVRAAIEAEDPELAEDGVPGFVLIDKVFEMETGWRYEDIFGEAGAFFAALAPGAQDGAPDAAAAKPWWKIW